MTAATTRNPVTVQAVQTVVVSNSRWSVGSAGTTAACSTANGNAAMASAVRIRRLRGGGEEAGEAAVRVVA